MDPIADMLNSLANACRVFKVAASVPFSKEKQAIAVALMKEGYVSSVSLSDDKKLIEIGLVYKEKKSRIHGVKRLSKPSRRVYVPVKKISSVRGGHGTLILSTPKGILTGELARKENVGGEALFTIW